MRTLNKIFSLGDVYQIIFFYSFCTALFFVGTYSYGDAVYSDLFILMFLQIFFYGLLINTLIATVYLGSLKKSELLVSNSPILLAFYFNLVFQLQDKIKIESPKLCYIISMIIAAVFLVFILYVTGELYFNEKVWSMAIYSSLTTLLELEYSKHFSLLFVIVIMVNSAYKLRTIVNQKITDIYKEFYPQTDQMNGHQYVKLYAVSSIVFWCSTYFVVNRFFKNNLISFISLGFLVPNIAIILQYWFKNLPIIHVTVVLYLFFNTFMIKAQIYVTNVMRDPKSIDNLDQSWEEFLKKPLVKVLPGGPFWNRAWQGFKEVAKNTAAMGGGPSNWGPKAAGGIIGLGTTSFFAKQYLAQGDRAAEIAEKANEIAEKANETAEKSLAAQTLANEMAEKALTAQTLANELAKNQIKLTEKANKHAKRGANAAEEYNKMAKQQNDSPIEID